MLLTDKVEINVGSMTKKYYENLGYIVPKMGGSKKDWKMVVRAEDLPKTSGVKVEVSCENCGEIRKVRNRDLYRSRTKTKLGADGSTYCGNCSRRFYHGDTHFAYIHGNPLYSTYKRNATKRNLNFDLTVDEFMTLNIQPCHYCGGMNEYSKLKYTGNGIDRMDNKLGYSMKNSVPCCHICNRAKNAMDYDVFVAWIERLRNVKKK